MTLAVFLLGGESCSVDTEDIAMKTNEIAPERFSWRKYPEQINLDRVRVSLSDAKQPGNGGYVLGSGKNGWILTNAGLEFAKRHVGRLESANLSRRPLTPKERNWFNRERARMLVSEAFSKFRMRGADSVSIREAEAFFKVDDYIIGEAREKKLERILNMFGDDPELGLTVKTLIHKVREGRNHESFR